MMRIIDDFTTGEDHFLVPVERDRSLCEGQMAGGKRHVIFSGYTANRAQPAPFQIDKTNQFNLTLPPGADISMNIIYGTEGATLSEDWSNPTAAFNIDIGSYTSVEGATFAIVAFSKSGGRLEHGGTFPNKGTSAPISLTMPIANFKQIDNPDPADINAINIVMVLQGGIWLRALAVT